MRVLIVEDEPTLAAQVGDALTEAGYAVDVVHDGEEGRHAGETEDYDAVVLDLGLPKIDGISVLKAWRDAGRGMPVLVLTARGTWQDKVTGIDAGADDYLGKPFQMEELLARLRALIRRAGGRAVTELSVGGIVLDPRSGRVTLDGRPVQVTGFEYRVLEYLMHHASRIVTRTELIDHIYAQDFDRDSNTIEVFVARLRKKLGQDSIRTVRGLGYTMAEPS